MLRVWISLLQGQLALQTGNHSQVIWCVLRRDNFTVILMPASKRYDGVTKDGATKHQGELNDRNAPFFSPSSGLFLDYKVNYFHKHDLLERSSP